MRANLLHRKPIGHLLIATVFCLPVRMSRSRAPNADDPIRIEQRG